jgi:hypothetical protein
LPFERNLHREHQFEGIAKAKTAAFIMSVKKNRGSRGPVITGSLMLFLDKSHTLRKSEINPIVNLVLKSRVSVHQNTFFLATFATILGET